MNAFIADWYAREHRDDLLREAKRERLAAAARATKPGDVRRSSRPSSRAATWIRVHLGHAAA